MRYLLTQPSTILHDATLNSGDRSLDLKSLPGNTNNGRTELKVYDTTLKDPELILTILTSGVLTNIVLVVSVHHGTSVSGPSWRAEDLLLC